MAALSGQRGEALVRLVVLLDPDPTFRADGVDFGVRADVEIGGVLVIGDIGKRPRPAGVEAEEMARRLIDLNAYQPSTEHGVMTYHPIPQRKNVPGTGLPALNQARAELGLALLHDMGELVASASRILVCTSPGYDFAAGSVPGNVRYVGHRPWVDLGPPTTRPSHVLRRTFATSLRGKTDLVVVAKLMEHSRLDATRQCGLPAEQGKAHELDHLTTDH